MRKLVVLAILAFVGAIFSLVSGVGVSLALENQDAFCASCHTEPEVTYYQQSAQASPATLAAFHARKQTACINCHSGGGVLGRSEGLTQGAQDLASYLSGKYTSPAVTINPLSDDSCTQCHADVLAGAQNRGNRSTNGHYHFFLPRWQAIDSQAASCVTCHTAHTNGLDGLKFMNQGAVAHVCDDCHNALGGR